MQANIYTLLDGVTATGAGGAVKLTQKRTNIFPSSIHVSGIVAGDVVSIEGTIATEAEIDAGTCTWTEINGGSFTADSLDSIATNFSGIRANLTANAGGGTVTVKIEI